MIDRMDRLSELIKREISIILTEEINDPRIHHITIGRVEITRDLRIAKIYYTTTVEEDRKPEMIKGLTSAGSYIRKALAERLSLKFTPRITFQEDKALERKAAVDDIFRKIEEERIKNGKE